MSEQTLPNFNAKPSFNKRANFLRVKFGQDSPLLETELNELQDLLVEQQKKLVNELLGKNGFTDFQSTYTGNTLTIEGVAVLDGSFSIITPLSLNVVEGENVYIAFKDIEIRNNSTIKSFGNLQSLEEEPNNLVDSRIGYETARRIQRVYNLVKDTTDVTFQYVLLGKVENVTYIDEESNEEVTEITFNPSHEIQVNLSLEGGSKITVAEVEPERMKEGHMWIQTGMEKPIVPGVRPPLGSFPERLYQHENDQATKKHIEIVDGSEIPAGSTSVIYYAESLGKDAPKNTFSQQVSERLKNIEDEIRTPLEQVSTVAKIAEIEVPSTTSAEIVSIKGKTITNYLPLFGKGQWVTPFIDTLTVLSETAVQIITTASTVGKGYTYFALPLTRGAKYTFSAKHNGYLGVKSRSGVSTEELVQADVKASSVTFTVPNNSIEILLVLTNAQDVGTFQFDEVSLVAGEEALPFVTGIKGITNPTITAVTGNNLVPPLRHWTKSEGLFEDVDGNEINYDAKTKSVYVTRLTELDLLPGKTYTFTVEGETSNFVTGGAGFYYNLIEYLTDGTNIIHEKEPYHKTNGKAKLTVTFTTSPLIKHVRLVVGGHDFTGSLTIRNAMLHEGAIPLPFEPYQEKSLTAIGTFHEGETIFPGEDGTLLVRRNRRELDLVGDNFSVATLDNRGLYKVVGLNIAKDAKTNAGILVKPNSKMIGSTPLESAFTGANQMWVGNSSTAFSGKEIVFTISNSDSGWGVDYLPTHAEIKAFLLGWRMNIQHQWEEYNGVGVKEWHKIYSGYGTNAIRPNGNPSGIVSNSGTQNIPTVINDLGYKPFHLTYDLEVPVTEVVQSVGSLALTKGKNIVKVSSGKIVREKVPSLFYIGNTNSYVTGISPTNVNLKSPFKNKVQVILGMYEDGKIFTRYGSESTEYSHGLVNPYMREWDFDPTAVYEMDYLVLEPYRVTVPFDTADISYALSLNGTIENLVEGHSDHSEQLASIQGILPGLISEGIVERGYNANGYYVKFANGLVLAFGSVMLAGGVGNKEIILPIKCLNANIHYNNLYANSVALLISGAIHTDGTYAMAYVRDFSGTVPPKEERIQYTVIGYWK